MYIPRFVVQMFIKLCV